ncbi:ligand-binding sensor domain-containing protein [Maribacter aurantiacus]|uniref:histidine kinase n=1 Tax=Maribacter aurantiacus TaxID=1882343 RepID=A0A5R8LU43_9FLAO|nr:sensor histidine kinase [Maribacter aurantiacus]TLF40774.1 GHKL domain-containing protein [Maribacter aurantiacus]
MKRTALSLVTANVLLVLGTYFSFSQSNLDSLTFIPIKAPISQNTVTEIFEDKHGFLWVGTTKGINRYDGSDFKVFEESRDSTLGLTHGHIEYIYEDLKGTLLIGTSRGLNLYDEKLAVIRPYPFQTEGGKIQSEHIMVIKNIQESLWLGTSEHGLYRYHTKTGKTGHLEFPKSEQDKPNNNRIIEIFPLANQDYFIVTEGKSYIIDEALTIKQEIDNLQNTSSALQIGASQFFLGMRNGELLIYNLKEGSFTAENPIMVSQGHALLAMEQDDCGNVWLGTENGGLSLYQLANGTISNTKLDYKNPSSIPNNSIWSLHKTRNGVMYVGTYKKGISFYDRNYYKFQKIAANPFDRNSLSNNIVTSFAEDKNGGLWIGTDGGGLNYWDRKANRFEHFSLDVGNLNTNVVLTLTFDKDKLWIGSWGTGFTIFDTATKAYEVWDTTNSSLSSNNIIDLLKDSKGRIWIANFRGGLQVYHPDTELFEDIELESEIYSEKISSVARLLEDDEGTIWVGTETMGVFRLIEENGAWSHDQYHNLSDTNFLSDNFVNVLTQDDDGNIWVGTQAGLNKFDPENNTFTSITKADGLLSDAIRGLVQDVNGFLWISTDKGITRYEEETGEFLDYDMYDGLQGDEYNSSAFYRTFNFDIVFGGPNGFNIFNPKQAAKQTDAPVVLLSDLKIFNTSVRPNDRFGVLQEDINQVDSITLSHKHSVFNIEFKALTLKAAEKVRYAYYLEGFENKWNYVGNKTSATYTNLHSGDYVLHVKSTNSDGIWNANERLLHIRITPPFWKTWWFGLILTCFILGLIYLIHYIRIRSLKANQLKLERKISERTKELQIQQKKLLKAADELSLQNEEIQRFTYSVTHDLKSPLSGIKGIANLIPMDINLAENPDMEKYLEMIHTSCDTMGDLIGDLGKMARIGKIKNENEFLNSNEIIQLARNLVWGKLEVNHIALEIHENLPTIYADKNRMIQVFSNLLDNAIKYMGNQNKPLIVVKAKKTEKEVEFQVIDNGSGMDKESLGKLFSPFERFHPNVKGSGLGLYMTKQIVVSHGGDIRAESSGKGKGTTFFITLPNTRPGIEDRHETKSWDTIASL